MAELVDQTIVDSLARKWELVSKSGTDKELWYAPGAPFDASTGAVGDYLIVPMNPGTMTFKRIA